MGHFDRALAHFDKTIEYEPGNIVALGRKKCVRVTGWAIPPTILEKGCNCDYPLANADHSRKHIQTKLISKT
jgi:hypothetical protein